MAVFVFAYCQIKTSMSSNGGKLEWPPSPESATTCGLCTSPLTPKPVPGPMTALGRIRWVYARLPASGLLPEVCVTANACAVKSFKR